MEIYLVRLREKHNSEIGATSKEFYISFLNENRFRCKDYNVIGSCNNFAGSLLILFVC